MTRVSVARWALLALMSLAVRPVLAEGAAEYRLSKAVPSNAFLAVHTRGHEGQAFVNEQWARVWTTIEKQRFDRDLKRIMRDIQAQETGGTLDPAAAEAFEAQWTQMLDLVSGVDWRNLASTECAFAMTLGFPTTEMVVIMVPKADTTEKSFKGFEAIAKTVAEMAGPALALATDGSGDTVTHRITVTAAPFPIGFTVARQKDVLLVGFGSKFVDESLALLNGGEGKPLASTERFQKAVGQLSTQKNDTLAFVDLQLLMKQVRTLMDEMFKMAANEGAEASEAETVKRVLGKLIDDLDMWDYVVAAEYTEGMKTTGEELTFLQSDAKSRALYPVIYGNGALRDPLKFVPKGADGVSATSGINLLAAYQAVMKFVREEVPDGESALAAWDEQQKSMDFNVENDLLSWIQGSFISFTVPGPSSAAAGEFAYLLAVSDESKARAALDRLTDLIAPMIRDNNGRLEPAVEEPLAGFRSVFHPMIGMMGIKSPTYGVKDGWMFVASSPEAVLMSLSTSEGKQENFTKNERFVSEGLPVGKDVCTVEFSDLTAMGEGIGAALQMGSFFAGMNPELSKNPVAKAAVSMLGKVGAVARAVDFYQSSCTVATFDGTKQVSRSVTNYRESPAAKAAAEAEKARAANKQE